MGQNKILLSVLLLLVQLGISFGLSVISEDNLITMPTPVLEEKDDQPLEEYLHKNLTADPLLRLMRPHGKDGVTHVHTNIYIRDILKFSRINPEEKKSTELYDWTVDMTFRQKWNDKRLSFDHEGKHPDYKYFLITDAKKIWKPDTFFRQAVEAEFHLVTTPNVLIRIYPNGDILYSTRLTVDLRCQKSANSANPSVVCPLSLASYAYTAQEVAYEWDEESPLEVKKNLYIPHFHLDKFTTESGQSTTKTGNYSTVTAHLQFTPQEE